MTTFTKSRTLIVIGICLSILLGCAGHQRTDSVRERIANAYGADRFSQVEQLQYTFNVKIGDKQIKRVWAWRPKANSVTFFGTADQGGHITYHRNIMKNQPSERLKKVDAWFINDQYWLLFPLHLVWDRNTKVQEDNGLHDLPLGKGQAKRITVTYPPAGGYTPGDVYELFIGSNNLLMQWVYRRSGAPEPTRMSTWEDHRNVGPLLISLNHRGPDENFRVWFTDVAIQ